MIRRLSESRPFKQRKSLVTPSCARIWGILKFYIPASERKGTRTRDVAEIREKYPNKIPVVLERYHKEKVLPLLDRTKFLVSQDLPMSQFMFTLRNRLCLSSTQTFYLLVNNKSLPSPSLTMMEIYEDNKDDDGFLYMSYASQETFGND